MDESFLNADNKDDRKKVKRSESRTGEESVDRISELPDSLLSQILSCLSMKDAIRTSILSTRWRSVWLSVPALDLDCNDFPDEDAFLSFVDRFLDHGDSPLHEFWVKYGFYDTEHDACRFQRWIDTLVNRKIQCLFICNIMPHVIGMPSSLFVSETLVYLSLDFVFLDIPEIISLPCVKEIYLEEAEYANDLALDKLISGCRILEHLEIIRSLCDNINVLCVRSRTLKSLKIVLEFEFDELEDDDGCNGVVIDTPELEYLRLSDYLSDRFIINNLGPSVKVDISVTFNGDCEDGLDPNDLSKRNSIREFLIGISSAKHMKISEVTLTLIHEYCRLEQQPQFYNLSHLEAKFGWGMFPAFFQSCPNLKFLVLDYVSSPRLDKIRGSSVPQCFLSSLESVEIRRPIKVTTTEMELIEYFLANSVFLKRVTIRCSPRSKLESVNLKELLTLPRRSSVCQVFVLDA